MNTNRRKAIIELIETESIYANDLIVIKDIYLDRAIHTQPAPIDPIDRHIIFSNIVQLSDLANHLSEALERDPEAVGTCFIAFIQKLFTIYCSKYGLANSTLNQFMNKINNQNKKTNKTKKAKGVVGQLEYITECKALSDGRTSAWDLSSLLIKPVQRCLKYKLLLDQIIKFTDPDHPDLSSLIEAREGMIRVAETINETKRRNEIVEEMMKINKRRTATSKLRFHHNNNIREEHARWTIPIELSSLITQVKSEFNALNTLSDRILEAQNSILDWFLSTDKLIQKFKNVYSLGGNNVDHRYLHLDNYLHLVIRASLNGPLKFLSERIKSEIIPTIEELKKLYKNPILLINKYERRIKSK
ncbi:hypothetical protein PSTG_14009 [Puccinia striiformis f. sp. tritici PST-78]|uniref:DH domain-containing protein n=1 Tax=Puccinia striiformis f. sp. tritici PST-78 TaxID=1165861 RepID=A0A0L0UZX0_9BASI|nr:hypothetical protein PSTG_14009 [Puccinia striiformis f. sp. tritici PST-78]